MTLPNGESKNWVRLCAAIDGFRARYGEWPTLIKIPQIIIDDLRSYLGDEMFEKVGSRLMVIEDDTGFIAADDQGRQYDYAHEGFSEDSPDVPARIWLEK